MICLPRKRIETLKELDSRLRLGLDIIFLDRGGELHLLDGDDLLISADLALLLGLLVTVLIIVHQFADRRFGGGNNLHQIEPRLLGQLKRLADRLHTELFTVLVDDTHLAVADFLVHHQISHVVCDTPP